MSDHPSGWNREGFSAMKVSKRYWGEIRLMLNLREHMDLEFAPFSCVCGERLRERKFGNSLFPD
jgi:hypothetical protein